MATAGQGHAIPCAVVGGRQTANHFSPYAIGHVLPRLISAQPQRKHHGYRTPDCAPIMPNPDLTSADDLLKSSKLVAVGTRVVRDRKRHGYRTLHHAAI